MARTCLQIVQEACLRIGILRPNAVVTSQDAQVLQLLALSSQDGAKIAERYTWQALQAEATFTTLAAQLQTTLAAVTTGFNFIINNTMWDRTLNKPIYGSTSQQEWQQDVSMTSTAPWSKYRIKGDSIYFYPVPAAGDSVYFEYQTKNWVTKAAGGTSNYWTADGDTPLLDDEILIQGLVWRWKHAKGLDYSEDFAIYENSIASLISRDASKSVLSMAGIPDGIQPFVVVPAGSWS